jgi:excisionase family DNA binding protein
MDEHMSAISADQGARAGQSPEDLLTLREAAVYARMGREFLRVACNERRLRHSRMGRVIRIRRRDVDAFIEALAVEPVTFDPPAVAAAGRRRRT